MTSPIGLGIIGPGFMGRTHARAFESARAAGLPCRIVAVAPGGFGDAASGNLPASGQTPLDLATVTLHPAAEALFADPRVHAVSLCTPTDTHVDLAIAALRAGKHVLVEKPVAISSGDVRRLADAARQAKLVCLPGMCMRYWPGWTWLRDRVRGGELGRVRWAHFERVGSRPTWSPDFYRDPTRCGGAIFDLHIHDVDFIVHLFGMPSSVSSIGTIDRVTTQYRFDAADAPGHVVADGGWVETPGFPFRMRFTIEFERGVAEFDLSRAQPLAVHTDESVQARIGVPSVKGAGYEGQALAFIIAVTAHQRGEPVTLPVTLEEAEGVTRVIEAEVKSLTSGVAESV